MSWDSYIDNLIGQAESPNCDRACIIGKDGSKWTTDVHGSALKLTAKEAADIGRSFKSGDFTPFMASGIYCEGEKYQFLREEEGKLVLAKKKGLGALTLQCSKTAIVIGHCPEGGQQGKTNKGVAVIADYLESLNM